MCVCICIWEYVSIKSLFHCLGYIGVILHMQKSIFIVCTIWVYCRPIAEILCLILLWLPNFWSHIWRKFHAINSNTCSTAFLFVFFSNYHPYSVFSFLCSIQSCRIHVMWVTALQQVFKKKIISFFCPLHYSVCNYTLIMLWECFSSLYSFINSPGLNRW